MLPDTLWIEIGVPPEPMRARTLGLFSSFAIACDVGHVEVNSTTDALSAEVRVNVILEPNLDRPTHAFDMNALRAKARHRSLQTTTHTQHIKRAIHLTDLDVAA
jgi:hypothetical protein